MHWWWVTSAAIIWSNLQLAECWLRLKLPCVSAVNTVHIESLWGKRWGLKLYVDCSMPFTLEYFLSRPETEVLCHHHPTALCATLPDNMQQIMSHAQPYSGAEMSPNRIRPRTAMCKCNIPCPAKAQHRNVNKCQWPTGKTLKWWCIKMSKQLHRSWHSPLCNNGPKSIQDLGGSHAHLRVQQQ